MGNMTNRSRPMCPTGHKGLHSPQGKVNTKLPFHWFAPPQCGPQDTRAEEAYWRTMHGLGDGLGDTQHMLQQLGLAQGEVRGEACECGMCLRAGRKVRCGAGETWVCGMCLRAWREVRCGGDV